MSFQAIHTEPVALPCVFTPVNYIHCFPSLLNLAKKGGSVFLVPDPPFPLDMVGYSILEDIKACLHAGTESIGQFVFKDI